MSDATVTVRPASPADEDDFRVACVGFDPGMADLPTAVFATRYQALVVRDDYCLPMAVQGDQVIGYALAQDYGPNLRLRFTIGRLHDLYVAPQCRRRGVGRLLMENVFGWARGRPEPMILHWQASRDAVAFYEALGLVADRVGDYPDYPGFSLDLRES
jgi:GNAT superfamily N-acetyltransferase